MTSEPFRPPNLLEFQAGASFYGDHIEGGARHFAELIASGHIVWARETPEVIAEFSNIRHRTKITVQIFNSQSFYVQLA